MVPLGPTIPKLAQACLGVHLVCRKPLATVWAVVSQRSEPEDVGAVFCCWLYTLEGNACPGFCHKTHWEVTAATQWQMAKVRDGGEQTIQEVITSVLDLCGHQAPAQSGGVGVCILTPSPLPRDGLPVYRPCRNYWLTLSPCFLHRSS